MKINEDRNYKRYIQNQNQNLELKPKAGSQKGETQTQGVRRRAGWGGEREYNQEFTDQQ